MHAIDGLQVGFRDIAAQLREQLDDGTYPAGARLPSEATLAARFECSRDTVRDALAVLVAEGSLVKRRGCPTMVRQPAERVVVPLPPNAIVTVRSMTLPEAEALGCGPGLTMVEVRVGDAEPVLYRGDQHTLRVSLPDDAE